jgi:phosphatidylinositol alpha-mannosyltransferase
MKIAIVSPYDYASPGGVVVHICHLYNELKNIGHDVRIITPYSGEKGSLDNEEIITIGKPIPVPSGGSIARVPLSPTLASPVRAMLNRERFDIIHLHEPFASTLTISILRVSTAINIGTFHAHHSSSWGYGIMKPFLKEWFGKLHGRIAVSEAAMNFVNEHFPGEYTIIPNGVDVAHFSENVSAFDSLRDGKLNILFVGRPEKRKGLKYLLGAYKTVKKEVPQSRLIVVGPGTQKYEAIAKKMGLEDVIFTGYVDNDELPQYYQSADIFCSPATGCESFGIILIEAMSASKPIVASAIDGYTSVMSDGVHGQMVPPKNEQALAQALVKLLNDESLRRQMGERGRIKANEYSWPSVVRMVNDYYNKVIESNETKA